MSVLITQAFLFPLLEALSADITSTVYVFMKMNTKVTAVQQVLCSALILHIKPYISNNLSCGEADNASEYSLNRWEDGILSLN